MPANIAGLLFSPYENSLKTAIMAGMKPHLDDSLTREFKDNLRAMLKARKADMNPKKLSLAAGLGETAVRDILQNRAQSPKLETVQRIAAALGVGVHALIPSLAAAQFEEIQALRAENMALREALGGEYIPGPPHKK